MGALKEGYKWHSWALIQISAIRGVPTPEDLVAELNRGGIEAVDEYGMDGSYLVAREAAAYGKKKEALEALQEALSYWRNPPLMHVDIWENDAIWGSLRESDERKRRFDEKRRSIGPIYGMLHYFPGW